MDRYLKIDMKRKLFKHQIEMLDYTYKVQNPVLFVEMRLMKTLVAIRRCQAYRPIEDKLHVLTAAPSSAIGSWLSELKMEGETDIGLLVGIYKKRLGILRERHKWNIINKEGHLALPEITDYPWDAVIIDEAFIRHPNSSVTKFFCKHFRDVPHKWYLSGLPAPEGDLEYFCPFKYVNDHLFGIKNFWQFRARYFLPDEEERDWQMTPQGKRKLSSYLSDTAYILSRKDAGLGCRKVYESREVDMPKDLRKTYKRLVKEFLLVYKDTKKFTKFAVAKFQWLRQITSGIVDGEMVWDGKIKLIEELVNGELKGQQIVIWCNFIAEVKALRKRFPSTSLEIYGAVPLEERIRRAEMFKRGSLPLLICETQCGLFGQDFSNADTAIYFSNPLAYEQRSQTEDRILKIGKKSPLLYIDLVVPKTVDVDIQEALMLKESDSKIVLRAAKRLEVEHG